VPRNASTASLTRLGYTQTAPTVIFSPSSPNLASISGRTAACLGAQAFDAPGRIVARQRSQVNAGDGAQQPCGLPGFFNGAPLGQRGRSALDRALVYMRPAIQSRSSGVPGLRL